MSFSPSVPKDGYRGRLAPSPTGYLHLGHARTFWIAQERARQAQGTLVLRNEDLDQGRVRPEFVEAMMDDLRWFGISWDEGPDRGGDFGPYTQSQRLNAYKAVFDHLVRDGWIYPCFCSRKDIRDAVRAPHGVDDEVLYPGTCRPTRPQDLLALDSQNAAKGRQTPAWRFRVPDHERITFLDGRYGWQCFESGRDFGDFVVWRQDGSAAYQLAAVADDHAMAMTEVVRGADLLLSTARQILLYTALQWKPPRFFHCPLVLDTQGSRLAKRHDALSLRHLRLAGYSPEEIRSKWGSETNPSKAPQ